MNRLTVVALLSIGVLPQPASRAADPPRRPNVLFCIADDASWPHFGAYGCNWVKTPAFDRLAKAGLLFENAYTPTAKCAPSRAALLTGRNPWQLDEAANHMCYFPAKFKTFAEALDAHGYFVGHTGKGWGPGVAQTADGKERNLLVRTVPRKQPQDFASAFRAFLADRPPGKPFFFWFGSSDPHRPYTAGSGVARGKKTADVDRVPAFWPDTDLVRSDLLDYALEVERFDAQVGQVLKVLEESGEQDHTLVIVTSDNGMPFPRVKGHTYELSNHMPLVMAWPDGIRNPGRKVVDYVSFVDLAPTFLDLAGVNARQAGMAAFAGRSLADVFSDATGREPSFVLVGRERNDWGRPNLQGYPVRGIVRDRQLLLVNFAPDRWPGGNPEADYPDSDPSPTKALVASARERPELKKYWDLCFGKRSAEELYDLATDPDCVHNLAAAVGSQARKEELRRLLWDTLQAQQDPRVLGTGEVFDRYLPTRKDWIGKYEREIAPKK
jgi:arylsulfatase A-like enzyme